MYRLLLIIALMLPLQAAASTVSLRPVGICTEAGCATPSFRKSYLRQIWGQVGIDVKVRKAITSDELDIDTDRFGELDPIDALYDFAFWRRDEGTDAATAYIGFTAPLAGRTVGMSFVNEPGLTLFPYGIVESLGGRYGAAVVAHELGHILGSPHQEPPSLMAALLTRSDYADRDFLPAIDASVFDAVRRSPLLSPGEPAAAVMAPASVPLPPSAAALAGALALLAWEVLRRT